MEYFDGEPLAHVGDLPAMAADRYGQRTAYVGLTGEQTFAELATRSRRLASVLAEQGLQPGDRVGLYIPNTCNFPSTYFGVIEAGLVPVPLNLRMDLPTLEFIVEDAEIDCVIGSPLVAAQLEALIETTDVSRTLVPGMSSPDDGLVNLSHLLASATDSFDRPQRAFEDVACQPYTSGTTGRPKGVVLTHENLLTTLASYDSGGLPVDPDETGLLVLPLFHIYALNAILGTFLYRGGELVLLPEPEPQSILTAIERHEISQFAGVPALFSMVHRAYLDAPEAYDLDSLALVFCAAAPLADDTRTAIESVWDVRLLEGWGMTETAPAGATEPSRGVRKAAGCVGPPVSGIELRLVDPDSRSVIVEHSEIDGMYGSDDPDSSPAGEIAVRGPQVFAGYYDRPEKTEAVFDDEGWFYTGDIARIDSDGYLWIVDRKDDMLLVGGENVYPTTVENALYDHPGVAEAAVVGVDHAVKGTAPVAFVVPDSELTLDALDLRRFCLERVPSYAHPRKVFFVDELPRSATQKVQRFELESDAADRLDGPLSSSSEQL